MLYPHFPLENHLDEEEVKIIIADLLDGVESRKPQLTEYLQSIERRLKERKEPQAIG